MLAFLNTPTEEIERKWVSLLASKPRCDHPTACLLYFFFIVQRRMEELVERNRCFYECLAGMSGMSGMDKSKKVVYLGSFTPIGVGCALVYDTSYKGFSILPHMKERTG